MSTKSRKRQALDVAVDLAVDAVCQRLGIHGACPVAEALVGMAIDAFDEEQGPKVPVPSGDRVRRTVRPPARGVEIEERAQRPEEKRDRFTELTPEERVFKIPRGIPLAFAPFAVRRAIIAGMASHVAGKRLGRPVGAGGRVVQSIAQRVSQAGQRRRLRGPAGEVGFVPGEGGF